MMALRVTGVALAGSVWMTGLCFADEESVRAYLANAESTSRSGRSATKLLTAAKPCGQARIHL